MKKCGPLWGDSCPFSIFQKASGGGFHFNLAEISMETPIRGSSKIRIKES